MGISRIGRPIVLALVFAGVAQCTNPSEAKDMNCKEGIRVRMGIPNGEIEGLLLSSRYIYADSEGRIHASLVVFKPGSNERLFDGDVSKGQVVEVAGKRLKIVDVHVDQQKDSEKTKQAGASSAYICVKKL